MKRKLLSLLALVLVVAALAGVVMAASAADSDQVTANPGAAVMDGKLDASYGNAVKEISAGSAKETIYLAHDSNYLYYCGVVTGADWSASKATTIRLLLGEYSPYRSINAFEYGGAWYERCIRFTLSSDGTNVTPGYEALGMGSSWAPVNGADYAIVEENGTMTYEVRLPKNQFSDSNSSGKVVLSSSIALANGTTLDWYDTARNKQMGAWDGIGDDWHSLCATVSFGKNSSETVLVRKNSPAVDGALDKSYGQALKVVTNGDVKESIYLLHDDNFLYYCGVVEGADWSSNATSLKLLLGEYNQYRGINAFEYGGTWYERCCKFTLNSDGTNVTSGYEQLGMGGEWYPVNNVDYAIKGQNGVMVYEVRLPRSIMGGDKFVMSSCITLPDGSKLNWYDTADRKAMTGWDGIGFCNDWINVCATVQLTNETAPLLSYNVKKARNPISMDGAVTNDEWGSPLFVGKGWQSDASNGYYAWIFDNDVAGVDYNNLSYAVYAVYDEDYLYVAANVEGWNWSKTDTKFNFMAGSYNPATTLERFEWQGGIFERFSAGQFVADVVDSSKNTFTNNSNGMDKTYAPVLEQDYMICWVDGNMVGYEFRIPWSQITPGNTEIAPGREFAFSSAVTLSDHDEADGMSGVQLNWERGALEGLGYDPWYVGTKAVRLVLTEEEIPFRPDTPDSATRRVKLTFVMNGGVEKFDRTYIRGSWVDLTEFVPTRKGYTFEGWFMDEALTQPVTELKMMNNGTVYAAWSVQVENLFADVAKDDWFYDAVSYVFDKELMTGTGKDTFSPDGVVTRGMMATILWRMEGKPEAAKLAGFADVKSNAYYAKAVDWAAENGIFTGYNATTFQPDTPISREQIAATMQRYAKFKGLNMSLTNDLSQYVDAGQISSWAVDSLKWAVGNGLITGQTPRTIAPKAGTTRAQLATILRRFLQEDVRKPLADAAASGESAMNKVTVNAVDTAITMDGEVTAAEWGNPVFSGRGWREDSLKGYTPWIYDNKVPGVNYDNVAIQMFARYDSEYLYVAATVDGWNWSKKDTKFRVGVAGYWPGTVVEQFEWEGARYERLLNATYSVDLDDSSKNSFLNEAVGMDKGFNAAWGSDYMVKYYGDNRVGYEIRIPWSQITPGDLNIAAGRTFAFSAALTLSDHTPADGNPGCVFNWEKGAMEGLGWGEYFMGSKCVLMVLK